MDRAALESILDRVEKATGPDRNLDAMLHHFSLEGAGTGNWHDSPTYTASIDAALALVERMLPGWFWRGGHSTLYAGWANVYREHPNNTQAGDGEHFAAAKSAPLAILAALLQALIARAE